MPNRDEDTPVTLLEWLGLRSDHSLYKYRTAGIVVAVLLSIFLALALGFAMIAAIFVMFGITRDVLQGAGTGPNLGAGALIAAILGAPFLIWSTVLKHQTLRYQKEGHITDRINKAVEQLGAEKTVKVPSADGDKSIERSEPNIEVRIGAILSLERIAQDSTKFDKGRDHVRVMEILCAYIRENAPASLAKDHDFGEWVPLKDDPTDEERAAHLEKRKERFGQHFIAGKVDQWAKTLPDPRADIAIALRVIGRRDAQQRLAEARWGKDARANDTWVFDIPCPALPGGDGLTNMAILETYRAELRAWNEKMYAYRGYRLDLRKTCLQRADLSDLCLSGANLEGVQLDGANLSEARMEAADLSEARMEGANLNAARIEAANLYQARMEGANMIAARMQGAFLSSARMEGTSLRAARIEGASMLYARMEGANLRESRLKGAILFEARLEGAILIKARVEGADLSEARMDGADLREARMDGACLNQARMDTATLLKGAVLSNACARGVDFSAVGISLDQVNSIFSDASATLPDGITPGHTKWPAHWPQTNLGFMGFRTAYTAWLVTQP